MPYFLVRHKVADYAQWKRVYDAHATSRKAGGSKGAHLFRNGEPRMRPSSSLEWDDLEQARQFVDSADLRQAM